MATANLADYHVRTIENIARLFKDGRARHMRRMASTSRRPAIDGLLCTLDLFLFKG
jgi:hypothetical protein